MARNAFSALDMSDDDEDEVQLSNKIDPNKVKKDQVDHGQQTQTLFPVNHAKVLKVKNRSTKTVVANQLVPRKKEKKIAMSVELDAAAE